MLQIKVIPSTAESLADGSFESQINEFLKEHGHQITERGMMTFQDKAVFYYDSEYVKEIIPKVGSLEAKKAWLEDLIINARKMLDEAEWNRDIRVSDQDNLAGLSKEKMDQKLADVEFAKRAVEDRKKEVELYENMLKRTITDIAERDANA